MNRELIKRCEADGLMLIPTIQDIALLAPLPAFWENFKTTQEANDGDPDPLDRYSKRIIGRIAQDFKLDTAFPSDGPPYPDFITWAGEADGIFQSPIGLFVHKEFGLWISFRGALLGYIHSEPYSDESPCNNCHKPCQSACPVNAFQGGSYNVEACRAHLQSGEVECWNGCLARSICPAASIPRDPEQSRFHMKSFAG